MSSSNEVPPFSALDESDVVAEGIFPDPARVPPYVSYVESYTFDRKPLGHVEVELVPMTADYASWWHDSVQPIIKENYRTASQVGNKTIRADLNWNWNRNFKWLDLHNYAHLSTRSEHAAYGLTMIARNKLREEVPVGMMTLVPRYLCKSDGFGAMTYTWYISSVPDEFYREYFQSVKLAGVGKALIDAAIIASYRAGLNGEVLLHAASEGGNELKRFYDKMGFKARKWKILPITVVRWVDRKGYMLLQSPAAAKIIELNDPYRRKGYVAE